ncbi:pirin family protein [Vibrio sp.]|nr:pirin family protein [Vibrio sp.]
MSQEITVRRMMKAQPTSDGDGVKIRRIPVFNDASFSPFLMLDELKSDDHADYVGGFPPHPHRGIETLTYMINGHFQHQDHLGNKGELKSGGAQWMAAGRGIIHSEMPIMKEGQLLGFQIWINQPAKSKMMPAKYEDFQPERIPTLTSDAGTQLKVISGKAGLGSQWIEGPLQDTSIPYSVSDLMMSSGSETTVNLMSNHQHFVYIYKGEASVAGQIIKEGVAATLSAGKNLSVVAMQDLGILVLSGEAIHEPVVHYGPFVMNSIDEIEQTIQDFNSGKFETY